MPKLNLVTRDTLIYALSLLAFVFGVIANLPNLSAPRLSGHVIYWWPTSHAHIWLMLGTAMVIMLFIGRSQNSLKYPALPTILTAFAAVAVAAAILLCMQCRAVVYADHVVLRTLTFHGLQTQQLTFADIQDVGMNCKLDNARGNISTEVTYQLTFANGEATNLAESWNEGHERKGWIEAIGAIDSLLRELNFKPRMLEKVAPKRLEQCLGKTAEGHTSQENATLLHVFSEAQAS